VVVVAGVTGSGAFWDGSAAAGGGITGSGSCWDGSSVAATSLPLPLGPLRFDSGSGSSWPVSGRSSTDGK